MFITGLMYTIVTIIKHKKDRKGCREDVTPIPYSSRSHWEVKCHVQMYLVWTI